eukprot:365619-Chlamydomonas_euryale.AAC.9
MKVDLATDAMCCTQHKHKRVCEAENALVSRIKRRTMAQATRLAAGWRAVVSATCPSGIQQTRFGQKALPGAYVEKRAASGRGIHTNTTESAVKISCCSPPRHSAKR